MELKVGYKHTEIGVIPEDWEVKSISQFTNPVRGGSPRPAGDPRFFNGDFIPWLTVAALTNIPISQIYVSQTETFLTEAGSHLSRNLEKETLIIANSGATLGVAKLLAINCCANDGIAALLDFDKNVSKLYVVYYINTKIKYLREVVATGNGQPNLNTELIGLFKVPLPPTLKEQTAIANALSDTDTWINSLEQLLTKKRQIKQGAMQELLQPKEGWEVKTIKEVAKFRRGSFPQPYGLDKWYDDYNGMPFVQVYDVDDNKRLKTDTKRKISEEGSKFSVFVEKGTVILTIQGSIGRIAITQYDAYVDRTLLIFESYTVKFNKYFFVTMIELLFEKEKEKAPGGIIKTITKEALSSFEITYPDFEEQTRIATILSDMDEEIAKLETKLTKAKQIKQGMMQELLTGRIRLV